jgi:hypothetical protein
LDEEQLDDNPYISEEVGYTPDEESGMESGADH